MDNEHILMQKLKKKNVDKKKRNSTNIELESKNKKNIFSKTLIQNNIAHYKIINLVRFYKYYIKIFLKNKFIRLIFLKIINDKKLAENRQLKEIFLKNFFFSHNFFISKLLFYYNRALWYFFSQNKMQGKHRVIFWKISHYYLKYWISNFFFKILDGHVLAFLSTEDMDRLHKLNADLNTLFLLKSIILKPSFRTTLRQFKYSLNSTSLRLMYNKKNKYYKLKKRFLNTFFRIKPKKKKMLRASGINLKNYRYALYKNTTFLIVKTDLNNIFLTAIDIYGKILYKCSGGFYEVAGQKRMDPSTVTFLTKKLAVELQKLHNKTRILIILKSGIAHKLIKSVFYGLSKIEMQFMGFIYCYNRNISYLRKKKARRV